MKYEDNLWIIDPLDGTTNFSRGSSNFAISVGLVDRGVSKLGVIYIPLQKKLYYGQADLREVFANNKPIKVSKISDLAKATAVVEWAYKKKERQKTLKLLSKFVYYVRQIKSEGSSVIQLANLAEGQLDIFLASGIKPWDLAAASIIVQKAGGVITTPKGSPGDVFHSDILITNGILHSDILGKVKS